MPCPELDWRRNLVFVWFAQFLSVVGFGFMTPFIPFYISHLGVTDPMARNMWVGLFTAAGHLGFCIMCPVWGHLADRYGRRIMILRANFVSALLIPLMIVVPGVGWLVALRFLLGVFSGTVTASQTLVAGSTPAAKCGVALGSLSSAVYGGTMLGSFLGGIIVDHFGFQVAFLAASLILFASGLLVLLRVQERCRPPDEPGPPTRIRRFRLPRLGAAWFILLLILAMGFARQFDTPFLPLLVEKINGPARAATWTGTIASLAAVAGVVSGIFLGGLADRLSAPKVAVISALLAGSLMVPQGLASHLAVLMVARFGMVFFAGGLDPVFMIWLAKSTPEDKRGTIFGLAASAKTLGWIASSLVGTAVAMFFGVRNVYLVGGALYLLLIPIILLAVRGMRRFSEADSASKPAPAAPPAPQ